MKYQWIEEAQTCEELSKELGCEVKGITRGHIVIGYEDTLDEEKKPIQIPITRKGIEIELENEDSKVLAQLDQKFQGLKRKDRQK